LPVMEDWKVMNNYIHDNNQLFEGTGGLPALLPPGGGILLMGVSANKLAGNRIENNDFFGLAVLDFCFALTGSPDPVDWCSPNPNSSGADPVPRDNRIQGNTFVNNGTDPPLWHPLAPFAADIIEAVFDPSAGNRYNGNSCTTYSFIPGGVEQVPPPCP
jgi:hypothetical protein